MSDNHTFQHNRSSQRQHTSTTQSKSSPKFSSIIQPSKTTLILILAAIASFTRALQPAADLALDTSSDLAKDHSQTVEDRNVWVLRNNNATICDLSTIPDALSFRVKKDGDTIAMLTKVNGKIHSQTMGTGLKFDNRTKRVQMINVQIHHEGRYECMYSAMGGDTTMPMKLKVVYLPEIHIQPSAFLKVEADKTTRKSVRVLQCLAQKGHPTPLVEWRYPGWNNYPKNNRTENVQTNSEGPTVTTHSHLYFELEDKHNGMEIECALQEHDAWNFVKGNQKGYQDSKRVTLNVQYKPQLPEITAIESDKLTCESNANPQPEYSWYVADTVGEEPMLKLGDSGTYVVPPELLNKANVTIKCFAQNTVGTNEIETDLEEILQTRAAQQTAQGDLGWKLAIVIALAVLVVVVIVGLFCLFKINNGGDNVYQDPEEHGGMLEERNAQGHVPPTAVKKPMPGPPVDNERVLDDMYQQEPPMMEKPVVYETANAFHGAEPPQNDQLIYETDAQPGEYEKPSPNTLHQSHQAPPVFELDAAPQPGARTISGTLDVNGFHSDPFNTPITQEMPSEHGFASRTRSEEDDQQYLDDPQRRYNNAPTNF